MFGYTSIKDFTTTMFGASWKPFVLFGGAGLINGLITDYMWDSASDIYFLWLMLFIDFATGIYASVKAKEKVTSKKMPRVFINILGYSLLLALSWNMALRSILFKYLPSVIYTGFMGVTFFSIYENMERAGVKLSKGLTAKIKSMFFK